ncbi:MAG: rhodanese-like domain-containing protein [Nitrospirota bacterium]
MKNWKDLVREAKQEVTLLQVSDVKKKMDDQDDFLLVDVREADEHQKGRVPEAALIPRGVLEMTIEQHVKDSKKMIILHCAGGGRSAVAALSLKKMGYENVASMEGGFGEWLRAGYPTES